MTLFGVFMAYDIVVPVIGRNWGDPTYDTFTSAAACCGFTVTVVGICAISTASSASGVPGTEAKTLPIGLPGGICLKSGGRLYVAKVHGPIGLDAVNHRPDVRK